MPLYRLFGATILWTVATAPCPAAAQTASSPFYVRANVLTANSYHWRGILRSPAPVIQMDATAALVLGKVSLAAGTWGNLEPHEARPGRLSDLPIQHVGFSEWDLWAQLGVGTRRVHAAAGVLRSEYRETGRNPSVVELYGNLRVQQGRWAYGLTAAHAMDGASGTYVEPSVSYIHLVNPFAGPGFTWSSTLLAGLQAGQRLDPASRAVPAHQGEGLTHMTLGTSAGATLALPLGATLFLQAGLEAAWRRDFATRVRADLTRGSALRFRAPLQLGITWPYRRAE